MRLQREIFKGIDVCKLLHDGAVVRLDDAFEISDKTASIIEFDGYPVIANIFCVNHVKHTVLRKKNGLRNSYLVFFLDIGKDHRGWAGATFQHVIVALLEFRIEALFRPFGGVFGSLGYFHVKGNTLLQNNLFIEHVDGAGNGYAEGFQDVFGLFLNIGLYASV